MEVMEAMSGGGNISRIGQFGEVVGRVCVSRNSYLGFTGTDKTFHHNGIHRWGLRFSSDPSLMVKQVRFTRVRPGLLLHEFMNFRA